jgi:hypothetical protein
MTVITSTMSPKQFLVANKIAVTAGMVLDPEALGIPAHPIYGPLPVVTVLLAKADGSTFLAGEIECAHEGCTEKREIGPGDWFQTRMCYAHKKKAQRAAKAVHKTPEEIEAAKLEREAKYASDAIERAEKKLAAQKVEAEKRLVAAKEKLELMKKVAAEKGVEISPKS